MLGALFAGTMAIKPGGSESLISGGETDPVMLGLNVILILLTILLGFSKLPSCVHLIYQIRPVLFLYAWAALSIVWSASRDTTFRGVVYLFVYLLGAAYIVLRFDGDQLIRSVWIIIALTGLLSFPAQMLLVHADSDGWGWRGAFLQKNELGSAMMIGITTLIADQRCRAVMRYTTFALFAVLLVLSGSVTSMVCTAAGMLFYVYLSAGRKLRPILAIAVVASGIMAALYGDSLVDLFMGTTGKDMTFTGRTSVWAIALQKIAEHPILGYGYGGFWSSEAETVHQYVGNWAPRHAHDAYLNIWLDLGIFGLVFTLWMFVDGWRRGMRLWAGHRNSTGQWLTMLIVVVAIHGLAEVDLLQLRIAWVAFLISYLSCRWEEYSLEAEAEASGSHFQESTVDRDVLAV
ncbi:MAG: O-antigen ligase family protein [Terracidiphilus sp.]|nr:O-antigen ligase family protein [Terracidiphilus sp.]